MAEDSPTAVRLAIETGLMIVRMATVAGPVMAKC